MKPRHARPATIPTNRANPPTKGKPIGKPKPLQIPVNILRIIPLRRINNRGNCGQSAARMRFNKWTLKALSWRSARSEDELMVESAINGQS
jgi:hypothetical protein